MPPPPRCLVPILVILACAFTAPASTSGATPTRPNILFVLTDDQGWPTLGCYGNQLVPTPQLDRLSAEGVRFTAAYVAPQCTPTRAMLLTGQHTARNRLWHVLPWYGFPWALVREPVFAEQLPRDTFTLAKGLRAAGYATGISGKWHLTTGADGDYVKLNAAAAHHYGFDFSAPPGPGSQNEGDKHVSHLTDQTIAFIERHGDRPWFALLTNHTVHGRVSAPRALVEKHLARGAPATGLHNATYLAALEHLDTETGRLLARLDALGLRERTIVVFLSDNGGVFRQWDPEPSRAGSGAILPLVERGREFSNAPLRAGKGTLYEGGIRVPCLVRWPGVVAPGRVEAAPVHVTDFLPTLLAAAGATIPADHPVDGRDLGPLLRGGTVPARPIFTYAPLYDLAWGATPAATVRDGDWKLIESFGDWFDDDGRYHEGRHLELYNLRTDLGETRDLAATEPVRATRLSQQLHAWIRSMGADIPGPNPHFDRARAHKRPAQKPPPP